MYIYIYIYIYIITPFLFYLKLDLNCSAYLVLSSADSCRNIHIYAGYILAQWIKDACRIKTQEDFFIKIFTSHFICNGTKGYSKLACEKELETEHNWNILTPKLRPSALCLSRSPGLLNWSPGVHSAGCWLSLLHLVYLRPQLYSPVHWLVELNWPLLFNSSALSYL